MGEEIGQRIAKARKRAKVSARELARRLDVAPMSVLRWESGENEIRASQLVAVARALKVSPRQLLPHR